MWNFLWNRFDIYEEIHFQPIYLIHFSPNMQILIQRKIDYKPFQILLINEVPPIGCQVE